MGLQVKEIDGKLVISIDQKTLASCAKYFAESFYNEDQDESNQIIGVNKSKIIQDVIRALRREDEDGTTPVHTLLDDAFKYCIEQGEESFEYSEDTK